MKRWFLGAAVAAAMAVPAMADVSGEYVEARSASVNAGACHYNGELTTAGREAVLAWKIYSGTVDGVRVDDLGVVAVVSGKENLADTKNARRSVLYVDRQATPKQQAALVKLLKEKAGAALGTVVAVKSAPFQFKTEGKTVTVSAGDAARLSVSKYPCNHCIMPTHTWYKPFTKIGDATVAQGIATGYKDATLGVSWTQETSDNVYLGTFAFDNQCPFW